MPRPFARWTPKLSRCQTGSRISKAADRSVVLTTVPTPTFRAVYTLRYAGSVYVLHAFQKKSKTGRETPRRDLELIKQRLREAEQIARERKR